MAFVSVTRLRIRSMWYLAPFFWHNFKSARQVVHSAGFLGGQLLTDRHMTFWTLTVWDSEQTMRAFRNTGPHRAAMPKLPRWCREASTAHWEQEHAAMPGWREAHQRMVSQGSELNRLVQNLKPVKSG